MTPCDAKQSEQLPDAAHLVDRSAPALRRMCPLHAQKVLNPSATDVLTRPRVSPTASETRSVARIPMVPIGQLISTAHAASVDVVDTRPIITEPSVERPGHTHWRRNVIVTVATAAVVVAAVREVWPAVTGHHGLRQVGLLWLMPAVLLAATSMLAAALLQRRLLSAAGLEVHVTSMMAITVAGNAMSVTLPLAGSTAGTAFTYHQLKQHGADLAVAGWTLAMSGIVSTSVLAVVLGVGATLAADGTTSVLGPVTIVLGVLPMAALVASLRWPSVRGILERVTTRTILSFQRVTHRGTGLDPLIVAAAFTRVAGFRLGWRAAATSAWLSAVNWTTDILCLAVCIRALGAPVPWTQLAVVYAAALGAASLSFTPAGVGLVEGAVALALVRTGTPAELAVVAALMYRAISCWLVLAVGWITYAAMRGPREATAQIKVGRMQRGLLPHAPR